MPVELRMDGVADLMAALRHLPEALSAEAGHEVTAAANATAVAVRTVYGQHRVTGRLQDRVTVETKESGPFGVAAVVRAADPIAWLFDNGSQARHWASGKSTGRMWGRTPPTHIFVRTAITQRRKLYAALAAIVRRAGLEVSGDV